MIGNLPDIIALVESGWRSARILVIGDVMLDKYIWGDVERISPEAPVPVVRATWQNERPGGAANVAMNLAGLGACVTVTGFAGGDEEQERLESMLAEAGIEPALTEVAGVPTTTKLRVFSGNQQMMRLDTEVAPSPSDCAYSTLLKTVSKALPNADAVVLSDYAKGVLTESVCRTIIDEANNLEVPVLVDPKQRSFSRYRGATTICPNLKELSAVTGEPVADIDRLLAAGQAQLDLLDMEFMVVTMGAKGIAVLCKDSRLHAPAVARQVYDVSGAGDTVIAVLALAMACDVEIEAAVATGEPGGGNRGEQGRNRSHSARRVAGRLVSRTCSTHGRESLAAGAVTFPIGHVALCRRSRGIHQWVFRHPAHRAHYLAGASATQGRSPDCRRQQRRLGAPVEGAVAADRG